MRLIKPIVLFILLLPFTVTAQNSFDIGLTTGMGVGFAVSVEPEISTFTPGFTVNANLKAMYTMRKWQFGASLDMGGMLISTVEREVTIISEHSSGTLERTYVDVEEVQYCSPYVSPNVFFNYKMNPSDRVYMYLGMLFGYVSTTHDFKIEPRDIYNYQRKVSGGTTGFAFGLVIHLSDHFSLDLSQNLHMYFLQDKNPEEYYAYEKSLRPSGGDFDYYDESALITEYDVTILLTRFGVRYRF